MTEISNQKPFKILSIDGGGIRGVFPAKFLASLEAQMKSEGYEKWQVYQNFDLICGTSTGGILALALSLGIPANDIYELYLENAEKIFGSGRRFLRRFVRAKHERTFLENLIRETFKKHFEGSDPRLKDCKTAIAIPVYDLLQGRPSVLKSNYHPNFNRDLHIPAYQAALATAAAPTYFTPYSSEYVDLHGQHKTMNNRVDGGVFANNPTLLAIVEAQEAFSKELKDLKILSIGTGSQDFTDGKKRKRWGIIYWVVNPKTRLIELFMQGQSQVVENLISLWQKGIDKQRIDNPLFTYIRINTKLDGTLKIKMDETNIEKLKKLGEKGAFEYHNKASQIKQHFYQKKK